ncbi:hypothetical protein QFC21_004010 [Naganishia friedmannii]|uniref:Uncharacterized protein n=1 Tax=Naganishia friedmannii TaxID=89922 RepID=A0ACC2VKK1_9TREE|nr:hypothetical protein QFC21_004010 [Naganishia friedmannii]
MTLPALADNLFQAAWTIVCVTLLHIAVYRVAHKDLRAWIAVNYFLGKCKDGHVVADDQAERLGGARHAVQAAGSQEVTNSRNRSTVRNRMRSCVLPVSLAAPILLSIVLQSDSSDKGYLDATLIMTEFIFLTFAATHVLTLFETEVVIVSVPTTKQNPQGWAVTDFRGMMGNIKALNFETARKFVPAVSLVLCSAVALAKKAPHSVAHAALLIGITMLGPMCLLRTSRGDNMKMKGWLIFMGSALGTAFTLWILLLLILATNSSRDWNLLEEGRDRFDRVWKNKFGVFGNDLIRAIQYALCGFLFSQMVALLRFDYAQSRNHSSEGCENAIAVSTGRVVHAEDAGEVKSILELSMPRDSSYVPAFSAPTFKGSIIGSYLATIIAVLIYPTPDLCLLWMPATLVGQSLGGALSVTWNNQWKALWGYEEM